MKKMNFSIQFLGSVFLVILFMLVSSTSINAQSFRPNDLNLSNPSNVFKNKKDAMVSLESAISSNVKDLSEHQGLSLNIFTAEISMLQKIMKYIESDVPVSNAAKDGFTEYIDEFSVLEGAQNKIQERLVFLVTYQ